MAELLKADYPVLVDVPTRWADNDHYGHVNNVAYYSYLDTAVNSWLIEAAGTDIRDLPAIGLVVETGCRYLAPLSFPQLLTVGLGIAKLGRASVAYNLAVFPAELQEPAAVARFVHVYVDAVTRLAVPVPAVLRTVMSRIVMASPA